ncbi:MAG: hypothetical protein LBT04_00625 [Prevotellaceae bacterium]|jgi:hypothetical protein|nr:hypothetical protein [Prevotellaceae bacterium]
MYLKIKKVVMIAVAAMFIAGAANAQDKMKIAVMDFKAGVGVGQDDVDGVSAIFGTYFNDPTKYILVERTQIDRVISEQGFQYSSLTNQQMVRIGQILNISRMVVGDVNIVAGQYNIDVRVVNAETGAVEFTDGETWVKGSSYRELMKKLAGRLLAKMSYTTATPNDNANTPPKSNTVVTLLGYLHVFPEDIGAYYDIPTKIIATINEQEMYGYNDWRLPTAEEWGLLKANINKLGVVKRSQDNEYYMVSGYESHGDKLLNVRLVTTGKTVAEQEVERIKQEQEQAKLAEERRQREEEQRKLAEEKRIKEEERIRKLNEDPHVCGLQVEPKDRACNDIRDIDNICPSGWRIATAEELRCIKKALSGSRAALSNRKYVTGIASKSFDDIYGKNCFGTHYSVQRYDTERDEIENPTLKFCESMGALCGLVDINCNGKEINNTQVSVYIRCVR